MNNKVLYCFVLHRQKALKALNERLQKLDQAQSSWPSMEDQGDKINSPDSSLVDVPTVVVDKGNPENPEGQSNKAIVTT